MIDKEKKEMMNDEMSITLYLGSCRIIDPTRLRSQGSWHAAWQGLITFCATHNMRDTWLKEPERFYDKHINTDWTT